MAFPPVSRSAALLALALSACAHAPPLPPPGPAPAWPPPPEPPRARWVASFPDPAARDERSGFRRFLDAVLGVEAGAEGGLRLQRPFGLAAEGGRFWVADPDGPRILAVDRATGKAEPVGCGDREWRAPMAVAPDGAGGLLVADAGAGAVVRVASDGRCSVLGTGRLERPTGVAALGGRFYAVDPPRQAVVAFAPDGAEVLRFGTRGEGPGELNFPTGIAAAPDGSLLVVDALNFRVCRFSAAGAFLGSFGEPGDQGGEFSRPKAVATDARGRIYVSDAQRDQVQVYRPDGTFDYALGESGTGPGQLVLPAGVAAAGGLVYVADAYDHRVQIYEILGETP